MQFEPKEALLLVEALEHAPADLTPETLSQHTESVMRRDDLNTKHRIYWPTLRNKLDSFDDDGVVQFLERVRNFWADTSPVCIWTRLRNHGLW